MKQEELNSIIELHRKWLYNENDGARADLCNADLRNADLCNANLRNADLCNADLRNADLCNADLCNADLRNANLWNANLCNADLRNADLRNADLCNANLCNADLRKANLCNADLCNANLYKANLLNAKNFDGKYAPLACPETGSFIGYKKASSDLIVELEICADAKRSSATSRKCRCSKAKVISITNEDGTPSEQAEAASSYTELFVYRVGEIIEEPAFDDDRFKECSPGIHFFITRQEAVDY